MEYHKKVLKHAHDQEEGLFSGILCNLFYTENIN